MDKIQPPGDESDKRAPELVLAERNKNRAVTLSRYLPDSLSESRILDYLSAVTPQMEAIMRAGKGYLSSVLDVSQTAIGNAFEGSVKAKLSAKGLKYPVYNYAGDAGLFYPVTNEFLENKERVADFRFTAAFLASQTSFTEVNLVVTNRFLRSIAYFFLEHQLPLPKNLSAHLSRADIADEQEKADDALSVLDPNPSDIYGQLRRGAMEKEGVHPRVALRIEAIGRESKAISERASLEEETPRVVAELGGLLRGYFNPIIIKDILLGLDQEDPFLQQIKT